MPCVYLASAFLQEDVLLVQCKKKNKKRFSVPGSSLMCTSLAVSHNKWDSSEKPSKTNKSNKVLSLTLYVLWWHPPLLFSVLSFFVFLCLSHSHFSLYLPLFIHSFPFYWSIAIVYLFRWQTGARFNKQMYSSATLQPRRVLKRAWLLSIFVCFGRCWCFCSVETKRVTE